MQFLANATFSRSQKSHKARTLCSSKSTGKETGKTHLCVVFGVLIIYNFGIHVKGIDSL